MDWSHKLIFSAFLILSAAIHGARADAMVSGTVYCDQCKDGERSLFDYPIYGVKVTMACADSNGQITMSREETTNWLGNYAMRVEGNPDLSNCYVQVSSSGQGNCNAASGSAQKLRLMFKMFDMAIYSADSLLSQPDQPMSYCPKTSNPVPSPVLPTPATPPPPNRLPPMPKLPPLPALPPMPPLPPLPALPPMPPLSFLEASACPYQKWTMTEYKCYWRAVNPDTKVAVVFGLLAARRYGTDLTLWQALQGRDDPYKTLLREATTALLNSYNSLQFPYSSVSVVTHMNWALMGSPRSVLLTGLRFIKANAGSGNVTCKFAPCN